MFRVGVEPGQRRVGRGEQPEQEEEEELQGGQSHAWLLNVSPLCDCHSVIPLDALRCRPQLMTADLLRAGGGVAPGAARPWAVPHRRLSLRTLVPERRHPMLGEPLAMAAQRADVRAPLPRPPPSRLLQG